MRKILSLLLIFTSVVFAETTREVETTQLQKDFFNLGIDLPFNAVPTKDQRKVRDDFKALGRSLGDAGNEKDLARSGALLLEAFGQMRTLGLLLPFASIEEVEERKDLMERFLLMEDRVSDLSKKYLAQAVKQVAWLKVGSDAWWALPDKYSQADAATQCAKLAISGTKDWRLPSLRELLDNYKMLRHPTQNPVFGERAAKFQQVWTGDRPPQPDVYYYVNFSTDSAEPTNRLFNFPAVCRGIVVQ